MNKKGFATLAIVLIVVAILVVGGIWYYESHQPTLSISQSDQASQTSTVNNVVAETSTNLSSSKPTPGPQYNVTTTSFEITSPQGGNQWIIGTTHTITWVPPQGVAEVAIELQNNISTENCQTSLCVYDSGYKSYLLTAQGNPPQNTGSFSWNVGTGEDMQNQTAAEIPSGTYSVTIEGLDTTGSAFPGSPIATSSWFNIMVSTTTNTTSVDQSSIGEHTYASPNLGISFTYYQDGKVVMSESGNTLSFAYLYPSGPAPENSIEVFKANPNNTFEQAVQNEITTEGALSTCQVELLSSSTEYMPPEFNEQATLSDNSPNSDDAVCEKYITNGDAYFAYNSSYPDRFYFRDFGNGGQYPPATSDPDGNGWADTIVFQSF